MREQARPAPDRRRGNATLSALVTALVLLAAPALRAEPEACTAWPGEPAPLPTLASPDALLSRWATLRAKELAATAVSQGPAQARRLWQHVLCLDPKNADAARALERLHAVTIHRPEVLATTARVKQEADAPALDELDEPIRVEVASAPAPARPAAPPPAPATVSRPAPVVPPPPAPAKAPPPPDWGKTDAALGQAEAKLRGADFETALSGAEGVRRDLQAQTSAPGAGERRARAEVLAATAEVALGRDDAARRSFERALAANPALVLDPARTSPKVRRVFDAVRAAKGAKP